MQHSNSSLLRVACSESRMKFRLAMVVLVWMFGIGFYISFGHPLHALIAASVIVFGVLMYRVAIIWVVDSRFCG